METMRVEPPETRSAITRKVIVDKFKLYITVGFYTNQQPCEVFITISKEGSTISGLLDSLAIAISFSLQHGVPWKQYHDKFRHTNFEPMDEEYSSIVDALAINITNMISVFGGQEELGPEGNSNDSTT